MKELDNPLGGERRTTQWRGHDIAYVKRGAGPPMLFVHCIHACAWSMEWRCVVPSLAERFTTYSVDLLGFGASAHPPLAYTGALYAELVEDFLTDVIGAPAVLVGSSLGAAYAVAAAAARPELARAVCAIGPAGVARLSEPGGALSGLVASLLRSDPVGQCLFSALTSRASIRFFLRDIYANPAMMSDEVIDLYWQAAHQRNARYGPASFVGFRLNLNLRRPLEDLACPLLLVWGERAKQTPLREAGAYRLLRPDAAFKVLPGGDLPHEESPEAFVAALESFLDEVPAHRTD